MAKKSELARSSRQWIMFAIVAALLAWMGLWVVTRLPVTDTAQIAFFILLFVATSSTVMPPAAYLNARFGQNKSPRIHQARFVRQSIWAGTFIVIAGWLQVRRILTLTLALILIAVLALTETFLITREIPPKLER